MASSLTQSAVKLSFATHPISVKIEDVIPMTTTRRRLHLMFSTFYVLFDNSTEWAEDRNQLCS